MSADKSPAAGETVAWVLKSTLDASRAETDAAKRERDTAFNDGYASRDGVVDACRKQVDAANARAEALALKLAKFAEDVRKITASHPVWSRSLGHDILNALAYLSASSLSEAGDGWHLVGGQNIQHIGELAAVFASLPIGRPVVVSSQFHEAAMVLTDLVTRSRLPAPPRDEVK